MVLISGVVVLGCCACSATDNSNRSSGATDLIIVNAIMENKAQRWGARQEKVGDMCHEGISHHLRVPGLEGYMHHLSAPKRRGGFNHLRAPKNT